MTESERYHIPQITNRIKELLGIQEKPVSLDFVINELIERNREFSSTIIKITLLNLYKDGVVKFDDYWRVSM